MQAPKLIDLGTHILPPEFQGKLEFQRVLGKGQFGRVCLYQEISTKKMVAVKTCPIVNRRILTCLNRECEALMLLTKMRVPSVVRYFHHVIYPITYRTKGEQRKKTMNYLFLFFEYCEGKTVAEFQATLPGPRRLHPRGAPPLDEVRLRYIAIQLLLISQELGKHNIIHRDIKPPNIIVHTIPIPINAQSHIIYPPGSAKYELAYQASGMERAAWERQYNTTYTVIDFPYVKLIDFGLCFLLDRSNPNALFESVAGSPYYMPPRRNPSFDLYSIGVTLLQLAFGYLPETGIDNPKVFTKIDRRLSYFLQFYRRDLGDGSLALFSAQCRDMLACLLSYQDTSDAFELPWFYEACEDTLQFISYSITVSPSPAPDFFQSFLQRSPLQRSPSSQLSLPTMDTQQSADMMHGVGSPSSLGEASLPPHANANVQTDSYSTRTNDHDQSESYATGISRDSQQEEDVQSTKSIAAPLQPAALRLSMAPERYNSEPEKVPLCEILPHHDSTCSTRDTETSYSTHSLDSQSMLDGSYDTDDESSDSDGSALDLVHEEVDAVSFGVMVEEHPGSHASHNSNSQANVLNGSHHTYVSQGIIASNYTASVTVLDSHSKTSQQLPPPDDYPDFRHGTGARESVTGVSTSGTGISYPHQALHSGSLSSSRHTSQVDSTHHAVSPYHMPPHGSPHISHASHISYHPPLDYPSPTPNPLGIFPSLSLTTIESFVKTAFSVCTVSLLTIFNVSHFTHMQSNQRGSSSATTNNSDASDPRDTTPRISSGDFIVHNIADGHQPSLCLCVVRPYIRDSVMKQYQRASKSGLKSRKRATQQGRPGVAHTDSHSKTNAVVWRDDVKQLGHTMSYLTQLLPRMAGLITDVQSAEKASQHGRGLQQTEEEDAHSNHPPSASTDSNHHGTLLTALQRAMPSISVPGLLSRFSSTTAAHTGLSKSQTSESTATRASNQVSSRYLSPCLRPANSTLKFFDIDDVKLASLRGCRILSILVLFLHSIHMLHTLELFIRTDGKHVLESEARLHKKISIVEKALQEHAASQPGEQMHNPLLGQQLRQKLDEYSKALPTTSLRSLLQRVILRKQIYVNAFRHAYKSYCIAAEDALLNSMINGPIGGKVTETRDVTTPTQQDGHGDQPTPYFVRLSNNHVYQVMRHRAPCTCNQQIRLFPQHDHTSSHISSSADSRVCSSPHDVDVEYYRLADVPKFVMLSPRALFQQDASEEAGGHEGHAPSMERMSAAFLLATGLKQYLGTSPPSPLQKDMPLDAPHVHSTLLAITRELHAALQSHQMVLIPYKVMKNISAKLTPISTPQSTRAPQPEVGRAYIASLFSLFLEEPTSADTNGSTTASEGVIPSNMRAITASTAHVPQSEKPRDSNSSIGNHHTDNQGNSDLINTNPEGMFHGSEQQKAYVITIPHQFHTVTVAVPDAVSYQLSNQVMHRQGNLVHVALNGAIRFLSQCRFDELSRWRGEQHSGGYGGCETNDRQAMEVPPHEGGENSASLGKNSHVNPFDPHPHPHPHTLVKIRKILGHISRAKVYAADLGSSYQQE